VLLLRGDDHHNVYLDAALRNTVDVCAVVVEPGINQRRALRRRGRWIDAVAAEYHHLRRMVLGKNRYRAHYFTHARHDAGLALPPTPDLVVASINAPAVHAIATATQPDVCVITCTTILSPATIDAIGVDIINIHGGHLPDYRGCHCFFFAIRDRQFDKIGSTVHFVNAGIDTGSVIEVARPAISNADTPETLYCKAEHLAAHHLVAWLAVLEDGEPITATPQSFRGRLCLRRHRRPGHDVAMWWQRRTGQLRLPTVDQGRAWQSPATEADGGATH